MIDMDAYTRQVHQKYLDAKYAEYDDESDVAYKKRKHVHKPIKKSDHKHMYENIVVLDPNNPKSFSLTSRCSVCGKVGVVQSDKRIDKKFPNVDYKTWLLGYRLGCNDEYEAFEDWCKKHYAVYDIPDFDTLSTKYI